MTERPEPVDVARWYTSEELAQALTSRLAAEGRPALAAVAQAVERAVREEVPRRPDPRPPPASGPRRSA